jgi:thymidylate synthase (FAD)
MEVKLISKTMPFIEGLLDSEDLITYTARVSNPSNQKNVKTAPKLLKYLIDHKHWSPFEQVSITFEIETSRAIAAQILRHRSFTFQEFSQRYSKITNLESFIFRKQSENNRQSSEEEVLLSEDTLNKVKEHLLTSIDYYEELISNGIAKECARMLLPLCTQTTLYMSGTLRSWIHYVDLRSQKDTQIEHREIALAIKEILSEHYPNTAEALHWFLEENQLHNECVEGSCNHHHGDHSHVQHIIQQDMST